MWIYILLPLSLILGNLRWRKAGRAFLFFQIAIGILWMMFAIQALHENHKHVRPDLMGILLFAGWWTAARLWDLAGSRETQPESL